MRGSLDRPSAWFTGVRGHRCGVGGTEVQLHHRPAAGPSEIRWRALRHVSLCSRRISTTIATALVLSRLENRHRQQLDGSPVGRRVRGLPNGSIVELLATYPVDVMDGLPTARWLTDVVHDTDIVRSSPLWPVVLDAAADPRRVVRRRKLLHRKLSPETWWPLITATSLLLQDDRMVLAAELAERAVVEHAATSRICDYDSLITTPVLAAARPALHLRSASSHPEDPTVQRLLRVQKVVPAESQVGVLVANALRRAEEMPLADMLGGQHWESRPWQEIGAPLTWGHDLLGRLGDLDDDESGRLWGAVFAARNEAIADQLHAAHGMTSGFWYVRAWYAGVQARAGRVEEARATLLAGLPSWSVQRYHVSQALPAQLATQEALRRAATHDFRRTLLAGLPPRLPWERP